MSTLMDPLDPAMDPWDRRKAAHLMRRAGFGMTPAGLDALVGDGSAGAFNAAVDGLVDYADVEAALEARLTTFGGVTENPTNYIELGGHWLFRMALTTAPLQEQLTLFYHDHFATEHQKIRSLTGVNVSPDPAVQEQKATDILRTQNYLLRTEGKKRFRDLLIAVTRDPAMVLYLDNYKNVTGNAQENYSRELMELFSMGVNQYTEDDVRELARVLTGESLDSPMSLVYMYQPTFHDPGLKILFGQNIQVLPGNLETEEAITRILDQTSPGEFMARKLISWFVTHEPDEAAVQCLAGILRTNDPPDNYNIGEALRVLLKSKYFYDPANEFAIYKTPVDFAVHLSRQLELTEAEVSMDQYWFGLAFLLRDTGMGLFEPPNVGGWIQGQPWINTVNLINRFNLAELITRVGFLISQPLAESYFTDPFTKTNDELIDGMRDRIVQDDLRTGERDRLRDHLLLLDGFAVAADITYYLKILGLAHLMCALPRYQLK